MVKSKLYPDKIDYSDKDPEYKKDNGFRTDTIYSVNIFGITIDVVIGSEIDKYLNEGVLHYVVYLYSDNKVTIKVGIWEILASNKDTIYDKDGDFILSRGKYVPFINKASLLKHLQVENNIENDRMNRGTIEEGENEAQKKKWWINEYLQDSDYSITGVKGTNSILDVIVEGLKGTVKETNIQQLQYTLYNGVDDTLYNKYTNLYETFNGEITTFQEKIKKKTKELSILKKLASKPGLNKQESQKIIEDAKIITQEYKILELEKHKLINSFGEFKFMENINNIDDMKEYMKHTGVMLDGWGLRKIEDELNIKCILLSQEMYEKKDYYSVLKCGISLNEEQTLPEYYLLCGYTDENYTLITYRQKTYFKFEEIPKKVKDLIVEKCIENNGGGFIYNKDFKEYIIRLNLSDRVLLDNEMYSSVYDNDLYNTSDILRFYIKSVDSNPGDADGDVVSRENYLAYNSLAVSKKNNDIYKHWRQKLDDKWMRPTKEPLFTLDGKNWLTVKHYHEGSQFKKGYPDLYHEFSLDSNSELSKDVNIIPKKIRSIDKKPDNDYNSLSRPRRILEREKALYAKFKQNDDLRAILLATGQAKLIQRIPGVELQDNTELQNKIRRGDVELMRVRKTLISE